MFIKMARANIRVGREKRKIDLDYIQIEIDGKLELSSRYGSGMFELMINSGDLAIGTVRKLSRSGLLDYDIIDGEIIDPDTLEKRKLIGRGGEFTSELRNQINYQFRLASLGN